MENCFNSKSPKDFYEIEIKALLSESKFAQLLNTFSQSMALINEEKLYSRRYRPNDLRLRYSDKRKEIVFKTGGVTSVIRRELIIPLKSMHEIKFFEMLFLLLGFKLDAPWNKKRYDFIYNYRSFDYILSLEFIEDFSHLLEIEIQTNSNDLGPHKANIELLMAKFGCEPANEDYFQMLLDRYIEDYKSNKQIDLL